MQPASGLKSLFPAGSRWPQRSQLISLAQPALSAYVCVFSGVQVSTPQVLNMLPGED